MREASHFYCDCGDQIDNDFVGDNPPYCGKCAKGWLCDSCQRECEDCTEMFCVKCIEAHAAACRARRSPVAQFLAESVALDQLLKEIA